MRHNVDVATIVKSHPMWVRGLKQNKLESAARTEVAPYVGAWIETFRGFICALRINVAPYVGAWIETSMWRRIAILSPVAPYVGAWIETRQGVAGEVEPKRSHPMWVRGLKHKPRKAHSAHRKVAPYVGAWIETSTSTARYLISQSHPMWVRGLKL